MGMPAGCLAAHADRAGLALRESRKSCFGNCLWDFVPAAAEEGLFETMLCGPLTLACRPVPERDAQRDAAGKM